MKPFLIGSVPYVNALPLVRWFETEAGKRVVQVRYAPPSVLAQWLRQGAVDVALVSSVEWFRRPETRFVPNLAIASENAVLSVRLFSKVPLPAIRSVALDTSSLTSSALTQILLERAYGISPSYHAHPPDLEQMLQMCDAGLLIGDAGMTAELPGGYILDLGQAWHEWTGLPFVWAVWLANADAPLEALCELLHLAYGWGMQNIEQIIQETVERTGMQYSLVARYLKEVMVYRIEDRFLQGLQRFRVEWARYHKVQ